jgi:DNA-binding NarL/FixJ family response regulator
MRILVADGNPAVRSAVTAYLRSMRECDTVCEAEDAGDLISQAQVLRPDIVLLDWGSLHPACSNLLESLHAVATRPSVIVLATYLEHRQEALAAGADFFVCKGDPPRGLLAAVCQVEADRGSA